MISLVIQLEELLTRADDLAIISYHHNHQNQHHLDSDVFISIFYNFAPKTAILIH